MRPNPHITLMGDLDNYELEGDAVHAMNELYDRIQRQGVHFLGALAADAHLGDETGLRHWTCPSPKQTIFFRAGNGTGTWQVDVYGHGKHYGDNNKQYKLYTWEHGAKTKVYTF
jgi:hypothetical protein